MKILHQSASSINGVLRTLGCNVNTSLAYTPCRFNDAWCHLATFKNLLPHSRVQELIDGTTPYLYPVNLSETYYDLRGINTPTLKHLRTVPELAILDSSSLRHVVNIIIRQLIVKYSGQST